MKPFEKYLYIDYENVQDVQPEVLDDTMKVLIIVGENQTKVPIQLVQQTQPFGNRVEWLQVGGKGRNALDFFIAYYIGRDVCLRPAMEYIIYSKDAGYDPLIEHLKKEGIKISRIVSFQELAPRPANGIDKALVDKAQLNLTKVAPNKRPKKRASLTGHVAALFPSKSKEEIDQVIEQLFIDKLVYEENGLIKYDLEPPKPVKSKAKSK